MKVLQWVLFLIALLVFNSSHWPHLFLPHYWDDAWSYLPAVLDLSKSFPSLLPNSENVILTRGHPLLYYFTFSTWLWLVGYSLFTSHLFALLISNALLISTFYCINQWANEKLSWVAIGTVILTMAHAMFYVQATLILPEIFICLLLVLTLYSYIKANWIPFSFLLALGLLIKESFMVFAIAFFINEAINTIEQKRFSSGLIPFSMALIPLSIHYLVLYFDNGWFLFPEHTDLMNLTESYMTYIMQLTYSIIFEEQNRKTYWLIFFFLGLFALPKMRLSAKLGLGLLLVTLIKLLFSKWNVGSTLQFPFVLLTIMAFVGYMIYTTRHLPTEYRNFLRFGALAFMGYWVFCSFNFFSGRYILSLVILINFAVSYGVITSAKMLNKQFYPSIVLAPLIVIFINFQSYKNPGDSNWGMYDSLNAGVNVFSKMSDSLGGNENMHAGFVSSYYFLLPEVGFISKDKSFSRLEVDPREADYIFLNEYENKQYLEEQFLQKNFTLVQTDTVGKAFASVYQRKSIPELNLR